MKDPDVVALRPYWQYRHGDSRQPRPEHLTWDGLILEHDHPWWDTHYTPNGWGCKCRILTLSKRDLARLGKDGPDKAPVVQYRQWEDRSGKPHQVPVGIDPGWNYNVGQAAGQSYKVLAGKFETMDNSIARAWLGECLQGLVFERFFDGGDIDEFPVAVLKEADKTALETKAQTVWLSRETLETHKVKHSEIGIDAYRLIPEILDNGEVYKSGDARLIYIKLKGVWYRAVLKKTRDGSENYFLSLFTTGARKTERQVRETLERVR
jgi:hypothetical protein